MLRDLVDAEAWQLVQDHIAATIGLPVLTVDREGKIVFKSGEFPFFCELVQKKGLAHCTSCRKNWAKDAESFHKSQCHAGLCAMAFPVIINGKKEGAIVIESSVADGNAADVAAAAALNIGLDSDELVDELPKLEAVDDKKEHSIRALLETFAGSIPKIANEIMQRRKESYTLKVQFDFLNELNSTMEMEKILNSTLNFLMGQFKLEDCSIFYGDRKARFAFLETRNQLYEPVEETLWLEIRNGKSTIPIDDFKSSFLFEKKHTISSLHGSAVAIPLLLAGQAKGMLVLYAESGVLKQHEKTFSALAKRLEVVLASSSLYRQAQESAVTDRLTGLYNKHYFLEYFKNEVVRAQRFGRPTSLIIFDIDDFKSYNDTYGHPEGDVLLAQVGDILKKNIAGMDICARYGGEEFCIILPETKQIDAQKVAERVRNALESHDFPNRKTTISIGCCTCLNSSASAEFMLKEADRALYKSKHLGKNRATCFIIVDKNISTLDVSEVSGNSRISGQ